MSEPGDSGWFRNDSSILSVFCISKKKLWAKIPKFTAWATEPFEETSKHSPHRYEYMAHCCGMLASLRIRRRNDAPHLEFSLSLDVTKSTGFGIPHDFPVQVYKASINQSKSINQNQSIKIYQSIKFFITQVTCTCISTKNGVEQLRKTYTNNFASTKYIFHSYRIENFVTIDEALDKYCVDDWFIVEAAVEVTITAREWAKRSNSQLQLANLAMSNMQNDEKVHAIFEVLSCILKHADLKIIVGDKSFNVHKIVIATQAPIFDTMMSSEFAEATSNVVK